MNESFGDRINALIQKLDIKKVRFAERIKVDQSYITRMIKDRGVPSDRVIDIICREFSVNKKWLQTGEGDMFVQLSRSQEISNFVGDILKTGDDDDFKHKFIAMLARLNESDWEYLEQKAIDLVGGQNKKD
jgi:transcriptional regulator with XRE-family HTH domain